MIFKRITDKYVLRFQKNDDFFAELGSFLEDENINSAVFNGIGSFLNCSIGFYNLNKKDYSKTSITETYEVVSLTGNVSLLKNQPFIHTHVVLSDQNSSVKGGHLFSARVGATLEIYLKKLDSSLERKLDSEIGLNLLDL